MTHHDDELDDFLAGRDELSRQLSALKQPAPPARLDDAITASIEARLAAEQAGRRRPAANMARWRAPLALAASVIGAVLLTMEWQRGEYDAQVDAGMRGQRPTAAPSAPAPAAATAVPPMPPIPPRGPAASAPVLAPAAADAVPPHPAKPAPRARPRPAPAAPPPQPAQAASAAPESPKADDMTSTVIANATNVRPPAELARAAPPAPAAAPAPLAYAARAQPAPVAADQRAEAWLSVIDEMLKAGLRHEALDEWRKFRLAYPRYPVPEQLSGRIKTIE